MRKYLTTIALIALFITQQTFADTSMSGDTPDSCKNIVNACKNAGFVKDDTAGKRFWFDCMKPIILGQTVQGVTVNANDVMTCRQDKITALQKEIQDFQGVATQTTVQTTTTQTTTQ